MLLMNVSKTVCGIVLVLTLFRIIGKTIKTLGFHNNIHLLNQSSLYVSSRGVIQYYVTLGGGWVSASFVMLRDGGVSSTS